MRRIFALLLLPLLLAAPAWAQDDLLARVMKAHGQLQEGQIDARIEVVGDVEFKGTQDSKLWFTRPNLLAWRQDVTMGNDTLTILVVADGEQLSVYDSSENGYRSRVYTKDVLTLAREFGGALGLQGQILKLMTGEREFFLNGKTLRIPIAEPNAQGECMFELVAADGNTDQFYLDGKTLFLKRMEAIVNGKPMAHGTVSYKLGKPDAAVYKFNPPTGATQIKPAEPQKGP